MVMESSAKSSFVNHNYNNDSTNEKTNIQNKMQKGNFKIGDTQTKPF